MSTNAIDADSIGPQIDLADVSIPEDVGHRMQRLFDTDEPVTDAEEWIDRTDETIEVKRGRRPTITDLCDTDDGDHAFESDDGDFHQEYVCVLDPIAYPFITDTPGTVHSVTAVNEAPIEIHIDAEGVTVDGDSALLSIGVSNHVEYAETLTPETIYQQVCGYIQTFEDEAEYAEWTGSVDAATTSLPLRTGIGGAGEIATTLFE